MLGLKYNHGLMLISYIKRELKRSGNKSKKHFKGPATAANQFFKNSKFIIIERLFVKW